MLTTVGKLAIGGVAALTTLVGGVAASWAISDPGPTPTLQDTGPPTITTPAPSWSESSIEPVVPTPTTQAPITAIPPPVAPPRPPVTRHPNPPPPVRPKPPPAPAPPPAPPATYYKNCTAAWAAGAAPLYRGQPGYRSGLDRDNDGVACERRP